MSNSSSARISPCRPSTSGQSNHNVDLDMEVFNPLPYTTSTSTQLDHGFDIDEFIFDDTIFKWADEKANSYYKNKNPCFNFNNCQVTININK